MGKKIIAIFFVASMLASLLSIFSLALPVNAQITDVPTLDPSTIPKYVDQLVIPPEYVPTYTFDRKTCQWTQEYKITMSQFTEQILPTKDAQGNPTGFAKTKVWGYGGNAKDAVTGKFLGFFQFSPSCTFDTTKGVPVRVTWINNITQPSLFAVDPTLHWANPNNIPMNMGHGSSAPRNANRSIPNLPTRI
jgi:hypothetical protein